MKKLIYFVLFFNCISIVAFAQKNYLPSTVVTTAGDTLRGLINYRNWEKNPYKIEFKKEEAAAAAFLGKDEIVWFSIDGKDIYKKAIVTKDMAPVMLGFLQEQGFEQIVQDTIFLRQVAKGQKLTLYELVDEKTHYYLQEQDQQPVELMYKVYTSKSNSGQVMTFNGFKNQLSKYALFDERLQKLIERSKYTEVDLSKLIIALDPTSVDAAAMTGQLTPPAKKIRLFAGAGITVNSLKFTGDGYRDLQNYTVDPSLGYSVRVGLDVFEKRRLQRVFFRGELAFGNFVYKNKSDIKNWMGQDESRLYIIDMNMLTLSVSANYNFINSKNFKMYAGVGGGVNYSIYNKNDYIIENKTTGQSSTSKDELDFENTWLDFSGRVGISNKKLDVFAATRLGGSFSNFMYFGTDFKTTGIYVVYHFKG